jgi:hypothetical protein
MGNFFCIEHLRRDLLGCFALGYLPRHSLLEELEQAQSPKTQRAMGQCFGLQCWSPPRAAPAVGLDRGHA